MRRLLVMVVLLLFSVSVTSAVFADEDPNACLTGGSMEGKCDFPTAAETDWAWTCGYYVGLFDNGEISRGAIPDWCYYPEAGANLLCQAYLLFTITTDLQLIGPVNTANNVAGFSSADGSCSGASLGTATFVLAADQKDAVSICLPLEPLTVSAIPLPGLFGYDNIWGCAIPEPG